METYLEIAQNYITKEIGEDFVITADCISDLNDFFAFIYQSKKFLETSDSRYAYAGIGYTFIYKTDNRIFPYGSGYSFEDALSELKGKISQEIKIRKILPQFDLQKRFDLKILKILKKQILIDTLLKFNFTYIIPEQVGSSIFRIAKDYKKKLFFERLNHSPIVFHGVDQDTLPELIIELMKNETCEFDIQEHQKRNFATSVNRAISIDFEPVW